MIFFVQGAVAAQIDLLAYMSAHIETSPADPSIPKYNRLKQFGAWVHQDSTNSCYDTRESVLARAEDPSVPLKFNSSGCSIATGLWHDPYTGTDFSKASDIQIDHVVPLKEAYYAGAYAWSAAIRCNFTNFIGNNFHLMAVSGHENMAKGDRAPDGYLPPDPAFHCAYVSNWMKIKAIWQLTATQSEVSTITRLFQTEGCADQLRFIDDRELARQRAVAETPIQACANL